MLTSIFWNEAIKLELSLLGLSYDISLRCSTQKKREKMKKDYLKT